MIKRIAIIILLLIPGMTACSQAGQTLLDGLPTPTPLPTPIVPEKPVYVVERGIVVNRLVFNGRVSPVIEESLAFGKAGLVKDVYVTRGAEVTAGTVLAELDLTEIEREIRDAEIALETAIFNLEKARLEHAENLLKAEIEIRKEQLNAQKAAAEQSSISELTSKQIDLQNAQAAVGGAATAYQEALVNDSVPQDVVDQLARGLEQAEQQLLLAEAAYNDALRKDGAKAIDAQINELDQFLKEMEYEKLLAGIDPAFEQDVEKGQRTLEDARAKLGESQLVAPFDGRILNVNIRKGNQAEALRTVIVIAQIEDLEITANLEATQLEELSVGGDARITLRNRPDETFSGTIRELPYPYGGGTADGSSDDRAVRIALEQPAALTLGELAEVTVILEEKVGVLWLPPAAIRRFQGRRFVVIQVGEGQQRVDVTLGIESSDRVEIIDGVEEGAVVIGE